MLVSERLKRLLTWVPGQRRFGFYRFLPFFFALGGAMEWFMINVRFGKETFCECGAPAGPSPRGHAALWAGSR
ncbi:SMIM4 protein, partial [Oxylabes madagascariensis]|nr:SMIM4 protein [Oxylabes madagascariensis]